MANPLKLLKLKPQGFQFIQEVSIDAPPAKVWAALLNIGGWFGFEDQSKWPKSKLEPHVGGRWILESPEGAATLVGLVAHIDPQKLLRINGSMMMTHLPVMNALIWELQERQGGKGTLLRFCQRTFGYLTKDVKTQYPGGWSKLLPQIKALAESGESASRSRSKSKARKTRK